MPPKRPTKSKAKRKTTTVRKTLAAGAQKLDLYAKHRNEYLASQMPSFVRVGRATYFAYAGRGKPGAPDFATGIGAMYSVAFTVKMAHKSGGKDYAVTKLEALWWRDDDASEPSKDTTWNWQLLLRVPPFVTDKDLAKAVDGLIAKGKPDVARTVQLIELREDTCVQILHVGPYME